MGESGVWAAPGYTEIRGLGSGASGRVVLARRDVDGRLVAIKYLASRLVGSAAFAERFQREYELMRLVRDPNVVEVYDLAVDPAGGGVGLVMEAVEGPTLRTLLGRGHGSPEAALWVLRGSLLGLAAAHDRGVVHRDYKPDNVLVDATGRSKLTDFGIATPVWEAVSEIEGTPPYMAPEQWNGYPPAPASDMYSAAVVFYECLTGVRPFRSQTAAELRTQHESVPPPLDAVPLAVRGLLERGLAKYPEQRYGDVRTFLADVEAAAIAGYGPGWQERAARDLAYVTAGLIAALPLLAMGAGTTAGTVGAAAATGAAGTGAAGAAGAAGTGAAGAAGTGAAVAPGTGAAASGLGHAAVQAGTHSTTAAQAFGQSATHTAAQAAAHASAGAGHLTSESATHAVAHTRRAATWTRHGAKLLHGKALVATVATVAVGAATTVAVVASGGSGTPQVSVAMTEQNALREFGAGNDAVLCQVMSDQLLQAYGGRAGCPKLISRLEGYIGSFGTGDEAQRAALKQATVDPSKVSVTGDTAVVPGAAVTWKPPNAAGRAVQLDIEDTAWIQEHGRWVIAPPKEMSALPTDLFPGGSLPGDFPSELPSFSGGR